MTNTNDSSIVCPHCGVEVRAHDEFCPDCGELFAESVVCHRHSAKLACGVCIVCCMPFCSTCGGRVQNRFLCDEHDMLEIVEGMARVFGSSNAAEVDFAKTSLETASLHPFVFSRKASPISLGAPEYTLYRASGEYDGHIVNEFKLMIPCQEFQQAEKKLRELQFVK